MLKCPNCGNTKPKRFTHIEDIPALRPVRAVTGNIIIVEGLIDSYNYEVAKHQHLVCRECFKEFPVPEDMAVEFT